MSEKITSISRAFSPVISAIIISAVVLSVGGAMWAFSQGTMTITAEDYAEAVINMTDTISERFIIEHAYYNDTHLYTWVFNYGEVDMEVKVNVKDITYPANQNTWVKIPSEEMLPLPPIALGASPGETLTIKAYTRRGNNAFYKYIVPEI